MKFVSEPNLPNCTKSIMLGEKYADIVAKKLSEFDIDIIPVPDNPKVDRRLSGHVDLSALHVGGNRIILASYLKGSALGETLSAYGLNIIYAEEEQKAEYPFDCRLNVCLIGRRTFCGDFLKESAFVNYFTSAGIDRTVYYSRQGYVKCSICVVDENSFITADKGLFHLGKSCGMNVLLIRPFGIVLDGFDYGFIGGASCKLSRDILAFTGHLNDHPDKGSILDFLSLHNIEAVYLSDMPAFDIGSAIPIIEK